MTRLPRKIPVICFSKTSRNQEIPININDVFITPTGLLHQWTVFTSQTKDFSRIGDLPIEDWS